jgi:hypothetical protein
VRDALHIGGRIVELATFGQQGLVEQDVRQIVETRVVTREPALHQGVFGVDLQDGLGGLAHPGRPA